MTAFICIDDNFGMMFNKRRQSSDIEVCKRVVTESSGGRLWMNAYSAKLFEKLTQNINVDEQYYNKANIGDYCFTETDDIRLFENKIDTLIIFKWNRLYPSDIKFQLSLNDNWEKQTNCTEFKGKSHERITCEIYKKKYIEV